MYTRIILSVGIVLTLQSCSFNLMPSSTPAASPSAPTETASGSYTDALSAASSQITGTPEFNNCMQPAVNMCVQSVGVQIAQQKQDVSFCKILPTADQQSSCAFGVVLAAATTKGDPALCESLTDESYKVQCISSTYSSLATTSGDISYCSKIPTPTTSGSTLPDIGTSAQDQCVFSVAMSSTATGVTIDVCQSIKNTDTQTMCTNMVEQRTKMLESMPPVPTTPPVPLPPGTGSTGSGAATLTPGTPILPASGAVLSSY